jgi:hypothetical protein
MTALPRDPRVNELRELFRHLQEFRAVYESTGLDTITSPEGETWSLWDLEYLYEQCRNLTARQQQAITLCLIHNMREKEAARAMGVAETNPVMMYATLGLHRLLDLIERGDLERFRQRQRPLSRTELRQQSLERLAKEIHNKVRIGLHDCWIYPTILRNSIPRLRIRSLYAPSGFVVVDPMRVMYEAHVAPLKPYFTVVHPIFGRNYNACVNPGHARVEMTEEGRRRQQYLLEYHNRKLVRS